MAISNFEKLAQSYGTTESNFVKNAKTNVNDYIIPADSAEQFTKAISFVTGMKTKDTNYLELGETPLSAMFAELLEDYFKVGLDNEQIYKLLYLVTSYNTEIKKFLENNLYEEVFKGHYIDTFKAVIEKNIDDLLIVGNNVLESLLIIYCMESIYLNGNIKFKQVDEREITGNYKVQSYSIRFQNQQRELIDINGNKIDFSSRKQVIALGDIYDNDVKVMTLSPQYISILRTDVTYTTTKPADSKYVEAYVLNNVGTKVQVGYIIYTDIKLVNDTVYDVVNVESGTYNFNSNKGIFNITNGFGSLLNDLLPIAGVSTLVEYIEKLADTTLKNELSAGFKYARDFYELILTKESIRFNIGKVVAVEKLSAGIDELNSVSKGDLVATFDLCGIKLDLVNNVDKMIYDIVKAINPDVITKVVSPLVGVNSVYMFSLAVIYKELNSRYRFVSETDKVDYALATQPDTMLFPERESSGIVFGLSNIIRSTNTSQLTELFGHDEEYFDMLYSFGHPYNSRLIEDNDILFYNKRDYSNGVLQSHEDVELETFINIYKQTRNFFYLRLYNKAFESETFYKLFVTFYIKIYSIYRFLDSKIENIKDIDFFDERDVHNFLMSYGLSSLDKSETFNGQLDLKKRVIRNFNELVKNKGSKHVIDLLTNVFSDENMESNIRRYMILTLENRNKDVTFSENGYPIQIFDHFSYFVAKDQQPDIDEVTRLRLSKTSTGIVIKQDNAILFESDSYEIIDNILFDKRKLLRVKCNYIYKDNEYSFEKVLNIRSITTQPHLIIPGEIIVQADNETDNISFYMENGKIFCKFNSIINPIICEKEFVLNTSETAYVRKTSSIDVLEVKNTRIPARATDVKFDISFDEEETSIEIGSIISGYTHDVTTHGNVDNDLIINPNINYGNNIEGVRFLDIAYGTDNVTRDVLSSLSESFQYDEFVADDPYWDANVIPESMVKQTGINIENTKYNKFDVNLKYHDNHIKSKYIIEALDFLDAKFLMEGKSLFNKMPIGVNGIPNVTELNLYDYYCTLKNLYKAYIYVNTGITTFSKTSKKAIGINTENTLDDLTTELGIKNLRHGVLKADGTKTEFNIFEVYENSTNINSNFTNSGLEYSMYAPSKNVKSSVEFMLYNYDEHLQLVPGLKSSSRIGGYLKGLNYISLLNDENGAAKAYTYFISQQDSLVDANKILKENTIDNSAFYYHMFEKILALPISYETQFMQPEIGILKDDNYYKFMEVAMEKFYRINHEDSSYNALEQSTTYENSNFDLLTYIFGDMSEVSSTDSEGTTNVVQFKVIPAEEKEDVLKAITDKILALTDDLQAIVSSADFMTYAYDMAGSQENLIEFIVAAIKIFISYTSEIYKTRLVRSFSSKMESIPMRESIKHEFEQQVSDSLYYDESFNIEEILSK